MVSSSAVHRGSYREAESGLARARFQKVEVGRRWWLEISERVEEGDSIRLSSEYLRHVAYLPVYVKVK